jgi:2-iminobutanoate/2-iminopropanoate deaminase
MAEVMSGKRRRIILPEVPEPPEGYWSNCFVIGNLVTIAGMVGRDRDNVLVGPGDPYAQTVAAFERMKLFVEAAGGTMSDIVKLTVYLTDIRHRIPFVEARKKFFSGDFPPCVVVGGTVFAAPELLVEIESMAVLGSGD